MLTLDLIGTLKQHTKNSKLHFNISAFWKNLYFSKNWTFSINMILAWLYVTIDNDLYPTIFNLFGVTRRHRTHDGLRELILKIDIFTFNLKQEAVSRRDG